MQGALAKHTPGANNGPSGKRFMQKIDLRRHAFQTLVTLMRVFFGVGWLLAGITKITGKTGEVSWFRYPTVFLNDYLAKALQKPNVPYFYKTFINGFALHHVTFFNYTIPVVQITIGLCLIAGLAIIPSVLIALFMHINFILSGNMNLLSLTLYTSAFGLMLCYSRIYTLSLDRLLGIEAWLSSRLFNTTSRTARQTEVYSLES